MKHLIAALLCLACCLPARAVDDTSATVQVLAKSVASWDGTPLPAYPAGPAQITLLKIRIPPGAQLPAHQHPVINAGVLLSGSLTVITENNETLNLKAGDAIVEVVGKWHYGMNTGEEPAEILVFYAGTPHLPLSIKRPSGEETAR